MSTYSLSGPESRRATIRRIAIPLSMLLALAVIYGPMILSDPLLQRDDQHILEHLRSVADWRTRLGAGHWNDLWIFQPIRDLTLHLNLAWLRRWGWGGFHLTNLAVFLGFTAFCGRAWQRADSNSRYPWAGVALLAVHPIFVGSVAWVSARKHLLAAFFLAWATATAWGARNRRDDLKAFLLYGFSLMSHPIGVAWPLAWGWIRRQSLFAERGSRWIAALGMLMMIGAATWNLRFYASDYVQRVGVAKIEAIDWESMLVIATAWTRYFLNLLLPAWLSAAYGPYSPASLASLVFAPIGLLAMKRWILGSGNATTWLIFTLALLAPVTLIPTQVFISDTYLLTASIGFFALLRAGAIRRLESRPRLRISLGIALFLTLTAFSIRQARTWESEQALWTHAAEVEPTPRNLTQAASVAFATGDVDRSLRLAERAIALDPADPDAALMVARALFESESLPEDVRDRRWQELATRTPWALYYRMARLSRNGEPMKAWTLTEHLVRECAKFGPQWSEVVADLRNLCSLLRKHDCAESLPETCRP